MSPLLQEKTKNRSREVVILRDCQIAKYLLIVNALGAILFAFLGYFSYLWYS